MLKIIDFVQNLSLDIVAGAVISTLFFANALSVSLPSSVLIGLAIAIWLIYTADHLLDARKIDGEAINPRHNFHQRHFKLLAVVAVLIFGGGIFNMFFLPQATIYWGLALVLLSGLYFLFLKLSKSEKGKELFGALVYAAGIAVGPLSISESVEVIHIVLLAQFFLLASVNLMLFPIYETSMDIEEGISSVATRDLKKTIFSIRIFLALSFILVVAEVIAFEGLDQEPAIMLLMSITLLVLFLYPQPFRKYRLYRILGDGVFFLPALVWLS